MDMDAALVSLCGRIEALARNSFAGVTLCNTERSRIDRALFPSLPPSFAGAIREVELNKPYFGSCVQSVASGEVVTSLDIANDTRFDPQWRQLCLDHGVGSLQSRPIYLEGRPFGTFVLAYPDACDEDEWDVALMTFAAVAASATLQSGLSR